MTNPLDFDLRFEASWSISDAREIVGIAAPYGVVANVRRQGAGAGDAERIRLAPGAFRRHVKDPGRVELRFEHSSDDDLLGVIGNAVELSESTTALSGRFRVLPTAIGEQAIALVESGLAQGLSVGFWQTAAHRESDGTLTITTGRLREVSLCREPAFAEAGVLSVASLAPAPRDDELDRRLRAAGFLA